MKPVYCVTLIWPDRKIEAPRHDKNDAQAKKRLHLCCDICGKDSKGVRFTSATLHKDGALIYSIS